MLKKKIYILGSLLVACSLLLFQGCSRYEDNSGLSFRRATKLIVDDWMLDTMITALPHEPIRFIDMTNDDTLELFNGQQELITLDESSILRIRVMETLRDYEVGAWLMTADKTKLEFNLGNVYKKTLDIKRLDMDYLWLSEGDSVTWKYHRHVVEF